MDKDISSIGEGIINSQNGAANPSLQNENSSNIAMAVKFLQDSRVASAPIPSTVSFLKSKGLSEDEIKRAFNIVGKQYPEQVNSLATSNPIPSHISPSVPGFQNGLPPNMLVLPRGAKVHIENAPVEDFGIKSTFQIWKQIILGSGAVIVTLAVIRSLLRKYVVPLYFPQYSEKAKEDEQKKKDARRSEEIAQLRSHIKEMMKETKTYMEKLAEAEAEKDKIFREQLNDLSRTIKKLTSDFNTYKLTAPLQFNYTDRSSYLGSSAMDQYPTTTKKSGKMPMTENDMQMENKDSLSKKWMYSDDMGDDDFMNIPPARVSDFQKENTFSGRKNDDDIIGSVSTQKQLVGENGVNGNIQPEVTSNVAKAIDSLSYTIASATGGNNETLLNKGNAGHVTEFDIVNTPKFQQVASALPQVETVAKVTVASSSEKEKTIDIEQDELQKALEAEAAAILVATNQHLVE